MHALINSLLKSQSDYINYRNVPHKKPVTNNDSHSLTKKPISIVFDSSIPTYFLKASFIDLFWVGPYHKNLSVFLKIEKELNAECLEDFFKYISIGFSLIVSHL